MFVVVNGIEEVSTNVIVNEKGNIERGLGGYAGESPKRYPKGVSLEAREERPSEQRATIFDR